MALQSVALFLVGFPALYSLILAAFIVGLGGESLNVSADSLFQKYVPLESLGTIRGLFDALATLVMPLSQLAFAWMIEKGIAVSVASLFAAGLACIGTALSYVCFVKFSTARREYLSSCPNYCEFLTTLNYSSKSFCFNLGYLQKRE
ncbi:MAG: hypothetical protein PWQ79_1108 [Thermococcaceae archaeon]|nr:hypothetical protein [Thermococcaceae archaeon]MDK2914193.1 hypothetical protein [Thermococcaceae archaeon]